jgi:hypothetical protein
VDTVSTLRLAGLGGPLIIRRPHAMGKKCFGLQLELVGRVSRPRLAGIGQPKKAQVVSAFRRLNHSGDYVFGNAGLFERN